MAVHLTAAQARKLNLDSKPGVEMKLGAKRRVRRVAKGHYHTRCRGEVTSTYRLTVECSADGRLVALHDSRDGTSRVAPLTEVADDADIDGGGPGVKPGVDLWRHDLEVARLVVRLVAVDVVDVLMCFGTGYDAVLVGSDVLRACLPDEFDVAALGGIPLRLSGRERLAGSESATRESASVGVESSAVVASAALARRARYDLTTVDAKNIWPHTVIVSALCGEEFTVMADEDRHLEATRHNRYQLLP